MMAKTPAERFTSLSAVSEELASILRNPGEGSRLALGPRPARSGDGQPHCRKTNLPDAEVAGRYRPNRQHRG